jgi:hypothetical protein
MHSPGDELKEEQQRAGLKQTRMRQAVPTRWSSTYLSIDVMLQHKGPLSVLCTRHSQPAEKAAKKAKIATVTAPEIFEMPAAAAPTQDGTETVDSGGPSALPATRCDPRIATVEPTRTRGRSGALKLLPGALAESDTESDSCESSDDGSVDCSDPEAVLAGDSTSGESEAEHEVIPIADSADSGEEASDDSSSSNDVSSGSQDAQHSKKRKLFNNTISATSSSSSSSSSRNSSSSGARKQGASKANTSKHSTNRSNSSSSSSRRSSKELNAVSTTKGKGKGKRKATAEVRKAAALKGADHSDDESAPTQKRKRQPSKRKQNRYMYKLTDDQWRILQQVRDLLQPFYEAQTALEGEKYITRSWLPIYINEISEHLEHFKQSDDTAVAAAATRLEADFSERWPAAWNPATRLAVLLDPRTKYMVCFKDKDVRQGTWQLLEEEMVAVYKLLRTLTTTANDKAGSSSALPSQNSDVTASQSPTSSISKLTTDLSADPDADDLDTCDDSFGDADWELRQRVENEIKLYKRETPIDSKSNPFEWWASKRESLPLMCDVARKWLAVPASSAASERLFSVAGLTVTKLRNRLSAKRVSTLVFLKAAWPTLEREGILYSEHSKGFDANSVSQSVATIAPVFRGAAKR